MRPVKRKPVNRGEAARNFSHKTNKTKSINVSQNPMRGGIRL